MSDKLSPAPIDYKRVELSCEGLGVAFSKLAQPGHDCPYAKACRAAVYLARFTHPTPKTMRSLKKSNSKADKLNTPHPRDPAEAADWLTEGAREVARNLKDRFLISLAGPTEVSFVHLLRLLSSRRKS